MRTLSLVLILVGMTMSVWAVDTPMPPRIGDPGSLPQPERFDPAYPHMAEWSRAGVEGGIPDVQRVVGRVSPGDDLQAAIDAAQVSETDQGVLLLAPGEYPLDRPLRMRTGLVLRGEDAETCVLASSIQAEVTHAVMAPHAVQMAPHSGLETLTIVNTLVRERGLESYQGQYENLGVTQAGGVRFDRDDNAWMQYCRVWHSGSNPVSVTNCGHVTLRDNHINGAMNKGGRGNGYYEFGHAHHILIFNERIDNIRHVSIMWQSEFIVMVHCTMTVDINFHDGLPRNCLVERCTVTTGGPHHWSPICFGAPPWQDEASGPGNLLWNNTLRGRNQEQYSGTDQVFVCRDTTPGFDNMPERRPMILPHGEPPIHGTLYAVSGVADDREALAVQRQLEQAAQAQAEAEARAAREAERQARQQARSDAQQHWRDHLLARITTEAQAGNVIRFESAMLRGEATIDGIDGRGRVNLRSTNGIGMAMAPERIRDEDLAAIASAIAESGNEDDRRSAAFFAFLTGDDAAGRSWLRGIDDAGIPSLFSR